MNGRIRNEVDGDAGIARIILDRPERRNALSRALVEELKDSLALADADERIRVAAISGAGPDFCAGADLEEVRDAVESGVLSSLEDAESLGELFLLIRRMDTPVVALVHGRALAGGCGLATACDLVLASSNASFGYPEVRLGFVPAMVMAILRRSVGEKRAFEMISLGESIDAERASAIGLVNRVIPADEFDEGADEFLADLSSRSASAVSLGKRLLYQIDGASFEAAIRAGAHVNALARLTDDCREGVGRFLDRRGS
ncbi:MAG: enoyl-CoA hydratase-related protein [marine benthic group bacterium]|nr:enoyl-CoA hydratase-related protein [Gemmatimonadota bacterium]MCL7964485.1 enoyl-CoA hydratase-related protein [Gemmatimonadota bacterium]MCL7966509.1 enoyl-CoA hydratase-related protein [Gemmatimonadota bacterium]MCL7968850.1 enoyl-CoA hydratase-related protein [Gemmatimonadota bacterium]MCL7974052.1 enoyl-CoA hydratase-related protein [Gemmatimonadota bacterium]